MEFLLMVRWWMYSFLQSRTDKVDCWWRVIKLSEIEPSRSDSEISAATVLHLKFTVSVITLPNLT